jgi:hypothetical protein
MQHAQPSAEEPVQVPGCPALLVISQEYDRDDGSVGLEVLQLPGRVRPCRNLEEPELASMVGVQRMLLSPKCW